MFIFQRFINHYKSNLLSFDPDVLKKSLQHSLLYLIIIVCLHAGLMMLFEHFSLTDALWLTLTTLSTTGYGDISATTLPGKISTVVLLYFGGIFVLAKFAGDYFDYRAGKRIKKFNGFWGWKMNEHLLIINTPSQNGEAFFVRFIEQLRNSGIKETTIQILTERFPDGLPEKLAKMPGVAHYTGSAVNSDDLLAVDPDKARYIIILAKDECNHDSDSRTFDILFRLHELELSHDVLIVAECVDDQNRKRFRQLGADIIIRPIRAYPEMLVRGLVAPGSEQIIENLFSVQGDEYVRYDLPIENMPWKDIVAKLIIQNMGLAVAYIDNDTGLVIANPPADTIISTGGIFLIIDDNSPKPKINAIKEVLK